MNLGAHIVSIDNDILGLVKDFSCFLPSPVLGTLYGEKINHCRIGYITSRPEIDDRRMVPQNGTAEWYRRMVPQHDIQLRLVVVYKSWHSDAI